MSDELRWVLTIMGFIVLMSATIATCVIADARIDATAPVVETCIKHPVTRNPLRQGPQ